MNGTHPLADDEPNQQTTDCPEQPTLPDGQNVTGSDSPEIGIELDCRTHYGHVRYAAGDEDGVIWYDPRDGRESFSLEQSSDDLDDVGDEILVAVEIRPYQPEEFGRPADRYMVTFHRARRERRGEDSEFMDAYTRISAQDESEVFESLERARDELRETVDGYSDAARKDAVRHRLEGETDD